MEDAPKTPVKILQSYMEKNHIKTIERGTTKLYEGKSYENPEAGTSNQQLSNHTRSIPMIQTSACSQMIESRVSVI